MPSIIPNHELFQQWNQGRLERRKNSNLSGLVPYWEKGLLYMIFIMILVTFSCKSVQSSESGLSGKCDVQATVVDYTGLDGCQKMLVLDDDRILLPIEAPDLFTTLHFGQRVSISYVEEESMVSICMAEDVTARITCLTQIENTNLSWIDTYTSKLKPRSVFRCSDDQGPFLYLLAAKESILYSLEGELLCSTPGKAMSDCVRRFNASKKCRIWGLP